MSQQSAWVPNISFPDWVLEGGAQKMQILQTFWCDTSSRHKISPRIYEFFKLSINPYWTALFLSVSSFDYIILAVTDSQNMAYHVINTFSEWLIKEPTCKDTYLNVFSQSDDGLMVGAFEAAYHQFDFSFYQLLFKIYRFDLRPNLFVPYVHRALDRNNFQMACCYAVSLDLPEPLWTRRIALPLYAQGELQLVRKFLSGRRDRAIQFVEMLDQLESDIPVPGALSHMLTTETIAKHTCIFARQYKVSEEHWPRAAFTHNSDKLRFFADQFYNVNAMPEEDWFNMIVDFVVGNRMLQTTAVEIMRSYGDARLAAQLVKMYGLSADDEKVSGDVSAMPVLMQDLGIVDDADSKEDRRGLGDEDEEQQYAMAPRIRPVAVRDKEYYLPNWPLEDIRMVTDEAGFQKCLAEIGENVNTVALFGKSRAMTFRSKKRLALLQLATDARRVYLLDVLCLQKQLNGDQWYALVVKVLANPAIKKLGFLCNTTRSMLTTVHPALANVGYIADKFMDLSTVCNRVLKTKPKLFKYHSSSSPSLSMFVHLCFGKFRNNSEKFSDWERRPLRTSQISHAAADVCCLFDIYEYLKSNCASGGIDFASFNLGSRDFQLVHKIDLQLMS